MTPQGPALIWCPFPDEASAADTASQLLDERLVGCANILGRIRSLFVWQGARQESHEVAVLFKTDAALLDQAVGRMKQLHPYESPAVIGWRCDAAAPGTAGWLGGLAEAMT